MLDRYLSAVSQAFYEEKGSELQKIVPFEKFNERIPPPLLTEIDDIASNDVQFVKKYHVQQLLQTNSEFLVDFVSLYILLVKSRGEIGCFRSLIAYSTKQLELFTNWIIPFTRSLLKCFVNSAILADEQLQSKELSEVQTNRKSAKNLLDAMRITGIKQDISKSEAGTSVWRGILLPANASLELAISLDALDQGLAIVTQIESHQNDISNCPKSDYVRFKFYSGRTRIDRHEFLEAEQYFAEAFKVCHRSMVTKKRFESLIQDYSKIFGYFKASSRNDTGC
jgi:hypothetical protein